MYNASEVYIEAKTQEGSALVVLPDAENVRKVFRKNEEVMALCALAPLARVGVDKAPEIIRRGNTDEIVEAGGLPLFPQRHCVCVIAVGWWFDDFKRCEV
ncbi:hypothetical protein RA28_19635 [Ruegeria sp. ANG-S4]|nr:hypothetical protein RA28_19635 [Ruegeria sp. ANG-S4]